MALATSLSGSSARAHPHNYIGVEAAVVVEDGTLIGVRHVWRFDRSYLDGLKEEYDIDRDGVISDAELRAWLAASVKNLETFQYFTTLSQGGKAVPLGGAVGQRVERSADGIALHFTVRPAKAADVKAAPLQIDIYDRTFFTEFVFGDDRSVWVEATGQSGTCTAMVALAPGGEQQKAITAFMKMFGRADAKLAPARAITVACRD